MADERGNKPGPASGRRTPPGSLSESDLFGDLQVAEAPASDVLSDELLGVPEESADREVAFKAQCRKAGEALRNLERALKVRRLYHPGNEAYESAVGQVRKKLTQYLEEYDVLTVNIGAREMRLAGSVVYENDDRDSSLAFQFYKDGIRRLTFSLGIDEDEIARLVRVLEEDRDGRTAFDDDLVTLLWKGQFRNLKTHVVDAILGDEEDDIFEEDVEGAGGEGGVGRGEGGGSGHGSGRGGAGGEAARALRQEVQQFVVQVSAQLVERTDVGRQTLSGDERTDGVEFPVAAEERIPDELPVVMGLTGDEITRLKAEVVRDRQENRFGKFVDILFALLSRESDELDLEGTAALVGQILVDFLERGDFPQLSGFAARVRLLADRVPPPVWAALEPQLERLGERNVLARLPDVLSRPYVGGVEALKSFLLSLPPNATETLRGLLRDLSGDSHHRPVVIEVLIRRGVTNVTDLADGLADPDADMALATISILRGLQDLAALHLLPSALKHEESRVRIAALDAIEAMPDPRAIAALLLGLNDAEPAVRLFTLKALHGKRDPRISTRIAQIIDQKSFYDLPAWEQQHCFDLLVENRGGGAFEILKDKLVRRSLLGGRRHEITRIAAARALAFLPIPATVELLLRVRDRERGEVGAACAEALKTLAARGETGPVGDPQ